MNAVKQPGLIYLTLKRKLQKSVEQRGLPATLRRCLTRPAFHAVAFLKQFSPARMALAREEREFDRRFGVETRRELGFGWTAKLNSENWKHGTGYAPAPISIFTAVLLALPMSFEDYVFIDFGSGKGRTLLLASEFPFREIIGVEYSADLHTVAEQNILAFRNDAQQCHRIRSVCQDAAVAPIPDEPLLLFFHQPFYEPVFEPLVQRIEQSLRARPRPCVVIYFDPKCAAVFDSSALFERIDIAYEGDTSAAGGILAWQSILKPAV